MKSQLQEKRLLTISKSRSELGAADIVDKIVSNADNLPFSVDEDGNIIIVLDTFDFGPGASSLQSSDFRMRIVDDAGVVVFIDILLNFRLKLIIDPCAQRFRFDFDLREPMKIRTGGRVDLSTSQNGIRVGFDFAIDSGTYQVGLVDSVFPNMNFPDIFSSDLDSSGSENNTNKVCTTISIPGLDSGIPNIDLCINLAGIAKISTGLEICPDMTGSIGGKEFVSRSYRVLSDALAYYNCEEEFGEDCSCLRLRYLPSCEFIANVGEGIKRIVTEPVFVNAFKSLDIDNDDLITFDEFKRTRQLMGASNSNDESVFKQFDIDNDGVVTYSEYQFTAESNEGTTSTSFQTWELVLAVISTFLGTILLLFIGFYISKRVGVKLPSIAFKKKQPTVRNIR